MDQDLVVQQIRTRLIHGKYHLVHKIGQGGFSKVYLAKDSSTGKEVAVKIQLDADDCMESLLRAEYEWYQTFAAQPGFPQIEWMGFKDDVELMVMELLGPSLEDLLAYCEESFPLKTTLMLTDQMLSILQTLHCHMFVHRDLKPDNFVLGTGRNGNMVYLIDFGLARNFQWPKKKMEEKSSNHGDESDDINGNELQEYSSRQFGYGYNVGKSSVLTDGFIGTLEYASVAGHQVNAPYYPKGDLLSLGYVLLRFMGQKLPWTGLGSGSFEEIYRLKSESAPHDLCCDLEQGSVRDGFMEYFSYLASLESGEKPNYDTMRGIFRLLAQRENIEYDNMFEWTIRLFDQEMNGMD